MKSAVFEDVWASHVVRRSLRGSGGEEAGFRMFAGRLSVTGFLNGNCGGDGELYDGVRNI